MAHTRAEIPPVDVRKVQEQFQGWRARKDGRKRIPENLWSAAAKLCKTHKLHRVARWLRLNHTALRDRAKGIGVGASRSAPTFVELTPAATPSIAASPAEYLLEVERAGERTVRIRMRGATVADVTALARALRHNSRQG